MSDFNTHFPGWHLDSNGYTLDWEGGEMTPERSSVRSKGGEQIPLGQIQNRIESIFYEFAVIRTPDDLLAFVRQYGRLTGTNLGSDLVTGDFQYIGPMRPEGDPVALCLARAELFHELLRRKMRSDKSVADYYGSHAMSDLSVETMNVKVVPDPRRGVSFVLTVDTLFDALLWHLLRKLASAIDIRECPNCGSLFEVGSGTGRRVDALFCSLACKTSHHSLGRSKTHRSS
jgi:hypothetical protein